MKKPLPAWSKSMLAVFVVVSISFVALGAGQQEPDAADGLLSKLRPDQPVILIERNDRFEIRPVANALERSHKVVEIGHDYIMLRDLTEQVEVVVPIYSIKAITTIKDL